MDLSPGIAMLPFTEEGPLILTVLDIETLRMLHNVALCDYLASSLKRSTMVALSRIAGTKGILVSR